jgi:hypothetical protein
VVNDQHVGRHHCQITQNSNGTFCLLDRNSTNGTFVNGRQVTGEVILNQTDVVRIGNSTLPWQSYFTSSGSGHGSGTMVNQGGGGYTPPPQTKPDSFLVWSILCTIFCCLPFGIAAIVNSSRVDSRWHVGDYEGSRRAASNARTWFWWSLGTGLVVQVIYIILVVVGAVAGVF